MLPEEDRKEKIMSFLCDLKKLDDMLPEEDRKEKIMSFLCDLFDCNEEKLKQMFVEPKPNAIIGEDKDES